MIVTVLGVAVFIVVVVAVDVVFNDFVVVIDVLFIVSVHFSPSDRFFCHRSRRSCHHMLQIAFLNGQCYYH